MLKSKKTKLYYKNVFSIISFLTMFILASTSLNAIHPSNGKNKRHDINKEIKMYRRMKIHKKRAEIHDKKLKNKLSVEYAKGKRDLNNWLARAIILMENFPIKNLHKEFDLFGNENTSNILNNIISPLNEILENVICQTTIAKNQIGYLANNAYINGFFKSVLSKEKEVRSVISQLIKQHQASHTHLTYPFGLTSSVFSKLIKIAREKRFPKLKVTLEKPSDFQKPAINEIEALFFLEYFSKYLSPVFKEFKISPVKILGIFLPELEIDEKWLDSLQVNLVLNRDKKVEYYLFEAIKNNFPFATLKILNYTFATQKFLDQAYATLKPSACEIEKINYFNINAKFNPNFNYASPDNTTDDMFTNIVSHFFSDHSPSIKRGDTLLHAAIRCNMPVVALTILEDNSIDINAKDRDDKAPLNLIITEISRYPSPPSPYLQFNMNKKATLELVASRIKKLLSARK